MSSFDIMDFLFFKISIGVRAVDYDLLYRTRKQHAAYCVLQSKYRMIQINCNK